MWAIRQLAAFSLGLAVMIWGFQLIYDPWAQERNERYMRENARLKNLLLVYLQQAIDQFEYYGIALVISAIIIFNRLKQVYFIPFLMICSQGLIFHSYILIDSERFSGFKLLIGASFYIAQLSALTMIIINFGDKKKHPKVENKKSKTE